MTETVSINPAAQAADRALTSIYGCIEQHQSFLLEAGAGAGKTYSLIKALGYLVDKQGTDLLRRHQQIACITYTNVASKEIRSRTDGHPAILSSTIHAFCWSLIKDFQPHLREKLPEVPRWAERLQEVGGIGTRRIDYELGYPTAKKEENILLGHNDVLALTVALMGQDKFRNLFKARYPIVFIDEYQDTNKELVEVLKKYFLDTGDGPLIGFFGDHWQKIYDDGCGKIEHHNLVVIDKGANFRSVSTIVSALNKMRPELPQDVTDPKAEGSVAIYHTNQWQGVRLTGAHWKDDLPHEVAHGCLEALIAQLTTGGWDFSPDKTRILMLTHNVLANEQGYSGIAEVFTGENEAFIKKEDHHIAFLLDTVEPVCIAYENKRFGEMFATLGGRTPTIHSHADKIAWAWDMDTLLELRATGTIGDVLNHLRRTERLRLPDAVERKERELEQSANSSVTGESAQLLEKLRNVSYQEVIALSQFVDEKTPFATQHGIKGAEFENVLVVVGRGWSKYNFNQYLEWDGAMEGVPTDKREVFERNRNLFYVVCSRPKTRLAILFTQKLSDKAIATLSKWFGQSGIHSIECI